MKFCGLFNIHLHSQWCGWLGGWVAQWSGSRGGAGAGQWASGCPTVSEWIIINMSCHVMLSQIESQQQCAGKYVWDGISDEWMYQFSWPVLVPIISLLEILEGNIQFRKNGT